MFFELHVTTDNLKHMRINNNKSIDISISVNPKVKEKRNEESKKKIEVTLSTQTNKVVVEKLSLQARRETL